MNKKVSIAIKIVITVLLLGCLLKFQYDYFQLVRFLGMVGFAVLAFDQYKKNQAYFVLWLASALLINPFIKIALGRSTWNVIDVILAVILIISIFTPVKNIFVKKINIHIYKKKQKTKPNKSTFYTRNKVFFISSIILFLGTLVIVYFYTMNTELYFEDLDENIQNVIYDFLCSNNFSTFLIGAPFILPIGYFIQALFKNSDNQ